MGKTKIKIMKIGIDISQVAYQGTGVATYTQSLIENLLKIDKENEYLFFFSSLRKSANWWTNFEFPRLPTPDAVGYGGQVNKSQIQNSNFQIKNYRFPPILLEYLWNKIHLLPIETFTGKLDVFHTSDWLEPPTRCPKVTTIHDLAVFKYPETFTQRGGHDIVQNLKRKLEWVKKESKLVIAVSENTKKDIVEILRIPQERIRVVYEACDTEFTEKSTEDIEEMKKKYGIDGVYILAVGTREPRKNLKRVIEAFSSLKPQTSNLNLVIAGKFGWGSDIGNWPCPEARPEGKLETGNLKLLGYVPKEDLAALYSGAEVFVYPSLYEGFGLPILDAMTCGCPVVTSNISSLPEVAGEAAVLVNPGSVEDIADGIQEAIKNKKDLIEKGFKRVEKFSWEKTAQETLKIYREVVEK